MPGAIRRGDGFDPWGCSWACMRDFRGNPDARAHRRVSRTLPGRECQQASPRFVGRNEIETRLSTHLKYTRGSTACQLRQEQCRSEAQQGEMHDGCEMSGGFWKLLSNVEIK